MTAPRAPAPLSLRQGPGLPMLLGLLLGSIALAVALGPLQGVPHVNDEIAYTLQARLFAGGMRTGPPAAEPNLQGFAMWVSAPRSYSVFPIGWPLMLALGEALHLGVLVDPLLAMALPVLTWLLVRERLEEPVARLAALVIAVSPGVWLLAASRMSQTSVLVALLGLAVVVFRCRDATWAWWAAGTAAAYVVLARPFDAVVVGIPLLLAGLLRGPGLRARLPLVLLPGLAAAVVLADNHHVTGHALVFPVNQWFDTVWHRPGCNRLGFGPDLGCTPTLDGFGHTPAKALILSLDSARRLDRLLLGLPGGLVLAAVGAVWGARRTLPLLLLGLLPVAAYALYWSPGAAYGARFWHPIYLVLPALVAVVLHRAGRRLSPLVAPLLVAGLPVATAPSLLRDLGNHYWCVDGRIRDALAEVGATSGTVLYQGRGSRPVAWPTLDVELTCTPSFAIGGAMALLDPTGEPGGLTVEWAPETREDLDTLVVRSSGPIWLVQQDLDADTVRVLPVH